ncbi:MAG: hypothetical protein CMG60_06090 [Candidatus Marinimicrobia bacterium]|nr:hypothetical protein [Candidatus Neomarinimicrobiota bacterium]
MGTVISNFILIGVLFSSLIAQEWEQSYSAGGFDDNGIFMGGSEALHLVTHKNMLFASIGYWQDGNNFWYGGEDLNIGWSQIICLENKDANWQVDFDLGYNFVRPEILKQVIFTKDNNGNALDFPDTMLIVGSYSANFLSGIVNASIFVRDDESNGSWTQIIVHQGYFSSNESYSMRDIELYTDQITGIENLLISVGTQGIYSGKYNPNVDGNIEIGLVPEVGPLGIRPLGITVANDQLYFSSGNKIFKRNDGPEPDYDVVHDFNDLNSYIDPAVGGIRGLTTIPNPFGLDESMLLMWCPNGQSKGTIFRLDHTDTQEFDRVYETKISLLVEDHLPGETVNYLLGAYNEFYLFTDPITQIDHYLIGIESLLQENIYPSWNGFYSGGIIVKRDNNGQYGLEEINDAIGFDDIPLVSVRCYVESPFEDENAIYFGGFDPNGHPSINNAWIYKKTWNVSDLEINEKRPLVNFKVYDNYPNPFNPITQIRYDLPKEGMVSIIIYDVLGRKIRSLLNERLQAGSKSVHWDATNSSGETVSSGVYYCRIVSSKFSQTKKMIFLK